MNVAIVIAVCSKTGGINGIRFEEIKDKHWACDWAFRITPKSASKEGYDKVRVSGLITIAESYPGCRYCEADQLLQCSCGILLCHNSGKSRFNCPRCRVSGFVGSEQVSQLIAQDDS
jgi:hypothetical protein